MAKSRRESEEGRLDPKSSRMGDQSCPSVDLVHDLSSDSDYDCHWHYGAGWWQMTTYVLRNGHLIDKRLAPPKHVSNPATYVISDTMEPMKHMGTGRIL